MKSEQDSVVEVTLPDDPPPARSPGSSRWMLWLLLVAVVSVYLWINRPVPLAAFAWETDLDAGLSKARAEGMPVLLEFQTAGCSACHWMDRNVFPRPTVAEALSGWVPIRIDGNAEPELSFRYGIEAFPTFLVLKPDGTVVKGKVGAMSEEEFVTFLQSAPPPATAPALASTAG